MDEQVEGLFERVKNENNGRLDILVNNAYAGVDMIFSGAKEKKMFYKDDPANQWDVINGVGLRNHFLCTVYASRYLKKSKNFIVGIK
jgi:dehydrogenase/reductase SDR family protein 1